MCANEHITKISRVAYMVWIWYHKELSLVEWCHFHYSPLTHVTSIIVDFILPHYTILCNISKKHIFVSFFVLLFFFSLLDNISERWIFFRSIKKKISKIIFFPLISVYFPVGSIHFSTYPKQLIESLICLLRIICSFNYMRWLFLETLRFVLKFRVICLS